MKIVLVILLMTLNIMNLILHSLGTWLLIYIHRNGSGTAQQIFLINLGFCEALMNLLECIRRALGMAHLSATGSRVIQCINEYILIVMFTGISLVYYLDMIYLTFDRLCDILLNIKYHNYWNEVKARWLLIVTWVIGILLSVTISLMHRFTDYIWQDAFFKYFFPTLEFAFVILAVITYGFIFHRFKVTRAPPTCCIEQLSLYQVFRKSRFYISVLIILTFLIFMVIPDLIYLFVGIINGNETETLSVCCWISYAVSNLLDAWIYIYMQPEIRNLLLRKVFRRRNEKDLQRSRNVVMKLKALSPLPTAGKVYFHAGQCIPHD